jgi:hypothetical protein
VRTRCLPPGHRQLGENPAAEILIIADFRWRPVRKNLSRSAEQHVHAIRNSVNVVLPYTSSMWAALQTVSRSIQLSPRDPRKSDREAKSGWQFTTPAGQ